MGGNATKNYVDRRASGGGGGGGTTNYNELENKPSINGVTLSGNKTSADLNISGGGGYDFSNITLLEENIYNSEPITAEVKNGFIIALYTNYSDGNYDWYFYTISKELLNLVPNDKTVYCCFGGTDRFGFQNLTRNNNTYTFTCLKEADGRRMNVYKF